jgi:serine/threonine-protein kinase
VKCPKCHRYYPGEYSFCPYDGTSVVERIDPSTLRSDPTRIHDKVFAGRYRIRGFVGKGAMARVYLAEDERTGQPVAVKVLEPPYRTDPSVRERFHREARAASLIGHPSIVRVFSEGEREEDGAPFLVMEFLVGETLGDYTRREGPMSVDLALSALGQAASALAATHAVGIVHRDVKPDNLFLLGEPGDPYELKVVDFGLSREPASNLTAAGVIMGTPSTMAPEQILGEGVDGRTDIYALGMVMYITLTDADPFSSVAASRASKTTTVTSEEGDDVSTLAHHLFTPPTPPRSHRPDLDVRVERIILKAIRKNPAERFQSMDELLVAIEGWKRPGATLPDPLPPDEPYLPSTTIGTLVKASLGRAIGL